MCFSPRFHTRRYPRLRAGFTLVELLVVISIIALLIAMLLPALKQARSTARAVWCQSNLKQLNIAVQAFVTSNKYFPPDYTIKNGQWDQWYRQIFNEQIGQMAVLDCPSDPKAPAGTLEQRLRNSNVSYGYNYCYLGGAAREHGKAGYVATSIPAVAQPLRGGVVAHPVRTIVFADAAINIPHDPAAPTPWYVMIPWGDPWNGVVFPRHGQVCNVAWMDGHVSAVKATGGDYTVRYQSLYQNDALGNLSSSPAVYNCWDRQ